MFTKIAVIGTGNIGSWMFQTFHSQSNLSVVSVSGRKIETLPNDLDLYIFALKDDIYEEVLKKIPFKMLYAVHTSGSLSQLILSPYAENYGVFYPYQTISRGSLYIDIPICIEGNNIFFENLLIQWAKLYFATVYQINEKQRFAMHLAAVFASNFTNAMYGIAYHIFKENNLDWSLIFPLLENTLQKAKYNDPHLCQTGPAKRNDISIMEKHCNALTDKKIKNLYSTVSKIITN